MNIFSSNGCANTMTFQKIGSLSVFNLRKNISKHFFFLFIFLFPFFYSAKSQVTFTAEADAKRIVEGQYFSVTFTLTNGSWTQFKPPVWRGFNQVGNPSQRQSSTLEDGKGTTSYSVIYNVKAKKPGQYTIGSATAVVNGKEIKTKPFPIEVVKGKKLAPGEVDTQNDFFVLVEPSTTVARIGQQITVDYKLYTKVNIESYDMGEDPEYNGFFAQDIRRFSYRTMQEEIDGEMYATKVFKRVALFPQQAGLLTIEPMNIRLGKSEPGRRKSFFFNEVKYIPYQVDSLNINVIPFPNDSIPPNFSGAVGTYAMKASVNNRNLTTDDAVVITMSIEGNGDLKRIISPTMDLGENFEVYDPRILEETTFEKRGEIYGRKILEYQALPLKPGNYSVQPRFTYYDTDSLDFITLGVNPLNVTVKKGRKKQTSNIAKTETDKVELLPIKTETTFSEKGSFFFGSPLFWILVMLPFLFLGGALVYRQKLIREGSIDFELLKMQRAQKVAVQKLSQAEQLMTNQNSKGFYDEVSRASFGYVCDKLKIPMSELSKANIQDKLQSLNVSQNHIDSFIKIIKTCEMALFAGMDNSAAMQETYDNAKEVIIKIEEELS
ncbi:MAG: BatD family protein [Saprospiraceae bacterium]